MSRLDGLLGRQRHLSTLFMSLDRRTLDDNDDADENKGFMRPEPWRNGEDVALGCRSVERSLDHGTVAHSERNRYSYLKR